MLGELISEGKGKRHRGSLTFSSTSAKLARLNSIAGQYQ